MTAPSSVVIVGAALAGVAAARELRARGYVGTLTLIGAEPEPPYDRPPLSKEFLAAERDIALLRADDLAGLGAHWRLGVHAVGIDTEPDGRHVVRTDTGESWSAEVVVLATGARARRLPVGMNLRGVHTLRTADDARALRASLAAGRRLAIVGAGFIGAEVASSARAAGLDVTVVEAAPDPLAHALGTSIARSCTALHARHGVRLITGTGVGSLAAGPAGGPVLTLTDGTTITADTVLVGIGSQPNTEWLRHPLVEVRDGFVTDAIGRTAAAGIYAIGDCASSYDTQRGRHHRNEHWTGALQQAKRLAADVLDQDRPPSAVPYFWSDQYGHRLQFAGYADPGARVDILAGDPAQGPFLATYTNAGRLVGVFARDEPRQFTRIRKGLDRALIPAPSS